VLQQHPSSLAENRDLMSSGDQPAVSPTLVRPAVTVGGELRAARLRLGWQLADISAWLRIRLPYLEALEEGRTADLPGTAYALGFLRTYSAALGLDPKDLSRRFRAEAAEVIENKPPLTFPAPVPERGVPVGAVVLVGLVLAVGAYVGWYRLSGEGKLPAEVVPPVPARLAPLAEQAIPPSVPPKPATPTAVASAPAGSATTSPAATSTTAPAAVASAPGMPAVVTPGSPAQGSIPPSSAAAMSLPAPQPAQELATSPAVPAPTQAAAAAPVPPVNSDVSRITLRATADDWIKVRDKITGQVLLNRMLKAGDTWDVPPKPNLLMTVGNAGGTEILVDGNLAPPLGGIVRRDVPLDPDLLRDGKAVAATPAAAHTSGQTPAVSKPTAQ
jgi:cytoskeleton protein RodZ